MAAEGNSTATKSVDVTDENVSVENMESTAETEESKETESEAESIATPVLVETSAPTGENTDAEVAITPEETYTVTEMSATMYAVNAVNLR
ncbi:MAG: hypothetical protein K2O34_11720 [Acetatifactor sp.]|nr:hypothetical protein [Acetatifactor sp.]